MYQYGYQQPARSWRQWQAWVQAEVKARHPLNSIRAQLYAGGVDQASAEMLIGQAVGEQRKRGQIILAIGAILFAIGVIVTLGTLASPFYAGNGTYAFVVAFGPIGCGLAGIVYGLRLLQGLGRL